ncbi:MAG: DNA topoisomerase 3 [Porphyromonas sp.]|nr:DNA topoisomerase 3 [Porphyromonas sp.]
MILCICEKPSVARDIGAVIGATAPKQGYLEGNGYRVTWTYGHFCTLKEPGDYYPQWQQWSLAYLPMLPERFGIKVMKDPGIRQQFGIIKELVADATEVINCGDAGQEGELIQRWVLQMAECRVPVKRLWLSSMTNEAIRKAFGELKPEAEYTNLYHAGLARAIGDWILGINATRLYTLKYRKSNDRKVLSVGRVQTPTLSLIVDRYEEIRDFKPEPYWEIKTVYREVTFSSTKGKYATEEEAKEVIRRISAEELTITKVTKKKGKEGAPRLFDLTSLQIEANKRYGLSADRTLATIQELYERKLVTYPRVDTTYLPDDVYPNCMPIIQSLYRAYPEQCTPLLQSGKLRKLKKYFDSSKVTDHHAIIPTGNLPQFLDRTQQAIYELILLRFLAIFYPDLEFEQTTVMADVAKIEFKATGRVVVSEGWKQLYSNQTDKSEEEEGEEPSDKQVMPAFVKGEHGPHRPDLLQKETRPPKLYTEATLLNAMETAGKLVDNEELKEAMKAKGIGRPSTRAAIIEILFKRNYIERKGKSIIPTQIGIDLIHTIQNEQIKSVEMTGEWEYKLRLIDRGAYSPAQFLHELKLMVSQLVQEVICMP